MHRWRLAGAALGAAVVLTLGWWTWAAWRPPARCTLRLAAGSALGPRYALAEQLVELAASATKRRINLTLLPSHGSADALRRIGHGELDLALVQGALHVGEHERVRQVAVLGREALHLLIRPELHAAVSENLASLRGRRVNLGEVGSGTHALAHEVLAFAGLHAPPARAASTASASAVAGDYVPLTMSYDDLMSAADVHALPDAVFSVSLLPSPLARALAARWGYRIAPLPFAEAFALAGREMSVQRMPGASQDIVQKQHVLATTIPPYTYDLDPPVPSTPAATLGTRLLLVGGAHVPADAVEQLLGAIALGRLEATATLEPPQQDRAGGAEFPLHAGALAYRARQQPLLSGETFDELEKFMSILAVVASGGVAISVWLRRKWRRRQDATFAGYIRKVAKIESEIAAQEQAVDLDAALLLKLQARLSDQKLEALQKFADGTLESDELMASFLAQVSDARNNLTRLILHAREVTESRARRDGRTFGEAWREAGGG